MPKLKGELRPAHGNTVLCLSRKTIIEDVIVDIASRELSSIFTQYLSRNGISGGISQGYCFNSCALSFPPRDISLTSNRIQGDIATATTAFVALVWTERDIVASPRLSFSLKSVIFPTKGSNIRKHCTFQWIFPVSFRKQDVLSLFETWLLEIRLGQKAVMLFLTKVTVVCPYQGL